MTTKLNPGEHTPATRLPVLKPMIGPRGKKVLVPMTPPPKSRGIFTQDGTFIPRRD